MHNLHRAYIPRDALCTIYFSFVLAECSLIERKKDIFYPSCHHKSIGSALQCSKCTARTQALVCINTHALILILMHSYVYTRYMFREIIENRNISSLTRLSYDPIQAAEHL